MPSTLFHQTQNCEEEIMREWHYTALCETPFLKHGIILLAARSAGVFSFNLFPPLLEHHSQAIEEKKSSSEQNNALDQLFRVSEVPTAPRPVSCKHFKSWLEFTLRLL